MALRARSIIELLINAKDRASTRISRLVKGLFGLKAAASAAGTAIAGVFAFRGIKSGITAVLDAGASIETLKQQVSSLFDTVEEGEDAFQFIEDFTKTAPQSLNQVAESFVKLKAFGIDPLNGSLQALVDQNAILGGTYETLQGLILAVGQAWSKQKLQGEEILQLVERGVPVWDLLAQATGKNVLELQKLSTAGKLGRREILLLLAEIGRSTQGAAAKSLTTFNGLVQQAQKAWQRFLRLIADAGVFEFAKNQLELLLGTVNKLAQSGELEKIAFRVRNFIISTFNDLKVLVPQILSASAAVVKGFRAVFGSLSISFNLLIGVIEKAKSALFSLGAAVASVETASDRRLRDLLSLQQKWIDAGREGTAQYRELLIEIEKLKTKTLEAKTAQDNYAASAKLAGESASESFDDAATALTNLSELLTGDAKKSFDEFDKASEDSSKTVTDAINKQTEAFEKLLQAARNVTSTEQIENTEKQTRTTNKHTESIKNLGKGFDDLTEAQKKEAKSRADSLADAGFLADALTIAQNRVRGLSVAALEAFNAMATGQEAAEKRTLDLNEALDASIRQLQDVRKAYDNAFSSIGTYARVALLNEQRALEVEVAFRRQALAANSLAQEIERLTQKSELTRFETGRLRQAAEETTDQFDLLGDQELRPVQAAIDAARIKLIGLKDEARAAKEELEGIRDSLQDALSTEDEREKRRFEEQLDRIRELAEFDSKAAREAEKLAEQFHRKELERLRERNQERPGTVGGRNTPAPTNGTPRPTSGGGINPLSGLGHNFFIVAFDERSKDALARDVRNRLRNLNRLNS